MRPAISNDVLMRLGLALAESAGRRREEREARKRESLRGTREGRIEASGGREAHERTAPGGSKEAKAPGK
jgi:hypothetical protein